MTTFKWKRFGKKYVVFDKEGNEIWTATEGAMSKQTLKKEMKIFLKSIKKKDPTPDEEGTETDE